MRKSFKYNKEQFNDKSDNMNFVPKERARAAINEILEERQKRKMKEIEELEKEYESNKI